MLINLFHGLRTYLKGSILKKILGVSLVSILINALGFLIPVYIAFCFGINKETDYFFLSYGVVIYITTIFSEALRSVVIPFLKDRIDNKIEFNYFISNIVYYCSKLLSILSFTALVILLVLQALAPSQLYNYLLLSLPLLYLPVLNGFCYGILVSLDKIYVAEGANVYRFLMIFLSILIFQRHLGIYSIILGYILGELVKLCYVFVVISRQGVKISFSNMSYQAIKDFSKTSFFQATSTTIACASPLIDKIVAAFLVVGSLSILDYGEKMFTAFNMALNSFLVIILAKWSSDVKVGIFDKVKFNRLLVSVFILAVFVFAGVFFFRDMLVDILYSKLSFDSKRMISLIFLANTAAFTFNAVSQVIIRAIMAFKSTRIMVRTAVIKLVLNFFFDVLFAFYWGVLGIAISTIFVNLVGMMVNYIYFIKIVPKAANQIVLNTKR